MVWGRHKKARNEAKKAEEAKREAEAARKEITSEPIQDEIEEVKKQQEQIGEAIGGKSEEQREKEKEYRAEDREDIEKSFERDFSGLTEAKKTAMQETANRQISQQAQRSNRQLQSEAGQRGFVGGDDALKMETARLANEAQGQFARDLTVMDADVALQKLTSALIMEESRAADRILMDAGFRNELIAMMDKKKQDQWKEYYIKHGA